ncbi:hypothetical protein GRZ55_11540 [Chelativorans sp. ZYF759]|uniref:hypothetical protein n=1 Tax=Chelativorans sp. ZYF759 TaxID=2692213 RepID=UPI00145C992B|nr:hypothetical protein [Chelativorans sp. ZYF759]NMG39876.1 hypothetical protein [Chelativorans sp. ZYF759]
MSLVSYHSQGTASVNNGQTAVTFSGASLVSAGIQPGDYFFAQGLMMPIAAVGGQNAATLVSGWPGTNLSGGNYQIVPAAEGARVALSARLVLEKLTNGNVEALVGLNLIADRLPYASGAGQLALTPFTTQARQLLDDTSFAAMRTTLGVSAQEVGTFTPGLEGITTPGTPTYTAQDGNYLKIGNRVLASFLLTVTSLGGATGALRVTGLPFSRASGNGRRYSMSIPFWQGINLGSGSSTLFGFFQDGGSVVRLIKHTATTGSTAVSHTDVSGAVVLYATITYEASS